MKWRKVALNLDDFSVLTMWATIDDACIAYMFEQACGDMAACPKCGSVNPSYYRVKVRKCYECKDCGYQLHPLAGTIFHKSSTSLRSWFYVIYLFSVAKNGVSAKEVERHLGVTYKCAWRIAKQVRVLMQQGSNLLSGIAEVDETYIGGKHRRKGMFGNKTAVIGIVEKQKNSGQVKRLLRNRLMQLSPCHSYVQASLLEPSCIVTKAAYVPVLSVSSTTSS